MCNPTYCARHPDSLRLQDFVTRGTARHCFREYSTDQLAVQTRFSGHTSSCLCLLLQRLTQVRQLTPHIVRLWGESLIRCNSCGLTGDRDLPWNDNSQLRSAPKPNVAVTLLVKLNVACSGPIAACL